MIFYDGLEPTIHRSFYQYGVPTGLEPIIPCSSTNMPSLRDLNPYSSIFLPTCRPYRDLNLLFIVLLPTCRPPRRSSSTIHRSFYQRAVRRGGLEPTIPCSSSNMPSLRDLNPLFIDLSTNMSSLSGLEPTIHRSSTHMSSAAADL